MLILTQADITRELRMADCIAVMRAALAARARGESRQPLRSVLDVPPHGVLLLMPGALPGAIGAKVLTAFAHKDSTPFDAHEGAVLLFDEDNGHLLAILDATAITAIRTAAVSAVATDALALPDASILAVLGTGVQAISHIEAMLAVRPLTEVRIWGRTPARAEALARAAAQRYDVAFHAVHDARAATTNAHVICTVTSSPVPILHGSWISPGAHINAVGAYTRITRELDTAAVQRARFYVDSRESALGEAGDLLLPIEEGAVSAQHIIGELGDVLIGRAEARTNAEQVTIFKSLGLSIEDVACAQYLYARCSGGRAGLEIDFGGLRAQP